MIEDYRKWLNIPYVKLHFTLEMAEDCILPKNKASALRGGVGQMMIRQNCILPNRQMRNEDCNRCDCKNECLVQRFLYTPMDIDPDFSTDKLSMGYLFECEDYYEEFYEGDTFDFNVILFGKSRVYLNLLLQALWELGDAGLGKDKARFYITAITNTKRQPILQFRENGMQIIKQAYYSEPVSNYVEYRLRQIAADSGIKSVDTLRFQTETALKYQKKLQESFSMEAIVSNLARRIYLFNCFAGNEMDLESFMETMLEDLPEIASQDVQNLQVKRFSSRHMQSMKLKGIQGNVYLREAPSEKLLPYLLAGELIHIGKNTSFGFGRYHLL